MIFRVHVAVLCAVPRGQHGTSPYGKTTHDAVAYTFGINGKDCADAVSMAVTAARNAVDRNGDFIGGVIVEVNCRCISAGEFDGYEDYYHAQIGHRGVFYVSGTTAYSIPTSHDFEATAELQVLKEEIKRSGLPPASFVHPQLPELPPTRVRLFCSGCNHWIEVDNRGVMYSFMGGLDMFTDKDDEGRRDADAAGHFMRRHLLGCALERKGTVYGIQQDDPRWSELDEAFRENESERNSS